MKVSQAIHRRTVGGQFLRSVEPNSKDWAVFLTPVRFPKLGGHLLQM